MFRDSLLTRKWIAKNWIRPKGDEIWEFVPNRVDRRRIAKALRRKGNARRVGEGEK